MACQQTRRAYPVTRERSSEFLATGNASAQALASAFPGK
jgi:hypothetical protein